MNETTRTSKDAADKLVSCIKRIISKQYSADEKIRIGPVAVWCRSFDSIMCSKGDELWAQEERMNFAGMRCELR